MQERKEHINIIYPEEGKRYRLNVRSAVGRLTVGKVKQCLAAASSCPIPLPDMILHLNGVPLSNDRDVCETLGIGNGATLSVEARAAPPSNNDDDFYDYGGQNYDTSEFDEHRQHQQQQQQQRPSPSRSRAASRPMDLMPTSSSSTSPRRGPDSFARRPRSDAAPSSPAPPQAPFALSEQRRLLELQTLEQQDAMLHKDVVVRDDILKSTLHHVDDEMDQANLRRRQLERQRENAEEELRRMREKETAAAQERQRLAQLRAQEAARASERAVQLAERREQLRAEQEATRAVALLKLENEKKKATLAQQKALLDAERERAMLEQDSYEATTKARELELRAREIDMEHQRLARIREARALDADRRVAVKQRLHYYARMGVEPPRALQREAAALLMDHGTSSDDDDDDDTGINTIHNEDEAAEKALLRGRGGSVKSSASPRQGKQAGEAHKAVLNGATVEKAEDGLVQSRGPSHHPASSSPPPQRASQQQQQQQARKSPSSASTRPAHSPSHPRPTVNSPAEAQQNTHSDNKNSNETDGTLIVPEGGFYDARENAEANLSRLGDDLGLAAGLQFDESDTCVISIDGEYTLLVTYDAATERLYLYSTLLASLPPVVQHTPEGRLKLYEFLLEASLLGREMCGGGVGASLRNNFVLMSASLYMPTSQPWSLRTLTPQFLHCLQHWRAKLTEFLATLEESDVGRSSAAAAAATGAAAVSSAASSPAPRSNSGQQPVAAGPGNTAPPTTTPGHYFAAGSVSPPWSNAAAPNYAVPQQPQESYPQQQQQHFYSDPNGQYSVSPSRSQGGSLSPSQPPLHSPGGNPTAAAAAKVIPVLGLEVTGTVLVNGMPTHYENGVLVVNAAGPSVLAGIQPNDFVEELNGVPIRSVQDFRRVIAEQLVPGMVVPVRINRGGVAMIVTVRVEAAWSL